MEEFFATVSAGEKIELQEGEIEDLDVLFRSSTDDLQTKFNFTTKDFELLEQYVPITISLKRQRDEVCDPQTACENVAAVHNAQRHSSVLQQCPTTASTTGLPNQIFVMDEPDPIHSSKERYGIFWDFLDKRKEGMDALEEMVDYNVLTRGIKDDRPWICLKYQPTRHRPSQSQQNRWHIFFEIAKRSSFAPTTTQHSSR